MPCIISFVTKEENRQDCLEKHQLGFLFFFLALLVFWIKRQLKYWVTICISCIFVTDFKASSFFLTSSYFCGFFFKWVKFIDLNVEITVNKSQIILYAVTNEVKSTVQFLHKSMKWVWVILLLYSHVQNCCVEMTTKQNLAWLALTAQLSS